MLQQIARCFVAAVTLIASVAHAADRPNILWIVVDDMSAHLSSYGETAIRTPNLDRMAREGTQFNRAFVTAPICSISRSALITGMYQTSINCQNHRSGRGTEKIQLPAGVTTVPALFKQAGYFTSIGGPNVATGESGKGKKGKGGGGGLGKTDYNFDHDLKTMYDAADWSSRKPGQPFFAQIQLSGGKLRGQGNGESFPKRALAVLGSVTPASAVKLPPYYPADPVIVEDWRQYLDSVRFTDWEVGRVLQRLESEGVLDQTVVFFVTDHGISHARGKQFLYDEGIRVPLIVRGPGVPAGAVREELVSHIDIAAASLALAGIEVPAHMQAKNFFSPDFKGRTHVFAARDRADETVDHIRAVRSERFKYIRNFLPQRPYLQPNAYKDAKPIVQAMRRLHEAGKVDAVQSLVMAPTRPAEELYDVVSDPFEIRNLAADPAHRSTLEEMRGVLDRWMVETNDHGRGGEPEKMYDSDMAVYLDPLGKKDEEQAKVIRANIALMKKWAAEGK